MEDPDAVGESGSAACGDLVRVFLRIARRAGARGALPGLRVRRGHRGRERGLRASGGRPARRRRCGSRPHDLDRDLGGLGPARRHGPEIVEDAVARALEAWHSDRLGRGRRCRCGATAWPWR